MNGSRLILCPCSSREGAADLQQRLTACGITECRPFHLLPWVAAELTASDLQLFLSQNPDASILPDRRRQIPPRPFGPDDWAEALGPIEGPAGSPNEPFLSPLALTQTGADQVHKLGIDGTGLRICIIDSGVDFSHPDLLGTAILDKDGRPLAVDFTETDLTDTLGHGTGVAGCIAAQAREVHPVKDDAGRQIVGYTRIQGLAPGARLMSAKVFDARVPSGYDSAIIAALEWAADNGAHIINMSLGGLAIPNDGTDPLAAAVAAVRARGILVVVSAGNEGGGLGTLSSPGSSPGALTAGASTTFRSFAQMGFLTAADRWTADQLAAFSSLGPAGDGRSKPDLLAPGAFDWGLAPTNRSEAGQRLQLFGGTSQAAPFLAGCAALLYQAYHQKHGRYPTPDEAERILRATADDLGLPAHMQGAGRVNIHRAVRAVLGEEPAFTVLLPAPAQAAPGGEAVVNLTVTNLGAAHAVPSTAAFQFEPMPKGETSVIGEVTSVKPVQEINYQVSQGTDLLHLAVTWPTEEHGPHTPRLLLAVYDPEGKLVNYQRPSSSVDHELGKCVDVWISRPAAGRWTVRIQLREGSRNVRQPFTFLATPHRRVPWSWVSVGPAAALPPGASGTLPVRVRVPEGADPGTYAGHVQVGSALVPLSVVVPIILDQGRGRFTGQFIHGYQGSWGNGDWIAHHLFVPAGTPSLVANVQWPDVDNAVEFYLIDPGGRAVMGKSNTEDVLDDGDSDTLFSQIFMAQPKPGMWRLLTHSFAFSGRGRPEPFHGVISTVETLLSPRLVAVDVRPGEPAPLALVVRNPGRSPLTVQALAQSEAPTLTWQPISIQISSGTTAATGLGQAGQAAVANFTVPHGTRLIGAVLKCEDDTLPISVSLVDPVSRSGRIAAAGARGSATVMEGAPVPGQWSVRASVVSPGVDQRQVTVKGAVFIVAPKPLGEAGSRSEWITIQPGAEAVLPVRLHLPVGAEGLEGTLSVTTPEGDYLGSVPFRVRVVPAAPQGVPLRTPASP